jgi:hypothetical protein
MVQFSNILIGMVIMAIISGGLMIFLADGSARYSTNDYNSSSLTSLKDTYYKINSSTELAKQAMLNITQEDTSTIDKIGFFFQGAYQGAKLMLTSFTSIFSIGDATLNDSGYLLGGFGTILKMMLGTIIVIILVVAIVMHIVTKSDRV